MPSIALPTEKPCLPRSRFRRLARPFPCRMRSVPMAETSRSSRERSFTFENAQGEKLVGTLRASSTPKTIVLCHGFSDHRDTPLLKALAEGLDGASYSSLRFDFSGNGESEGVFEFGNYAKEVEDLRQLIVYAREGHLAFTEEQFEASTTATDLLGTTYFQRPSLEICGIIGHSKGGDVVLLYASKYDDVDSVINIAGRFDLRDGITMRYGDDIFERLEKEGSIELPRLLPDGTSTTYALTQESLKERMATDMEKAARSIEKARVLTIHGTGDAVILFENGEAFDKCISQHELYPVQKADHSFTKEEHRREVVEKCVKFVSAV